MQKLNLDSHSDIGSAWVNEKVNEIIEWINEHEGEDKCGRKARKDAVDGS